jgi:hypothetical protein
MDPLPRRPRMRLTGARILYAILRIVIILALSFGAFALSVVASVRGLTGVLVGAALVALVALRVVHSVREHQASAIARPHRAFVITGVVVIGFFVLLTIASQIWASH